MSTIGARIKIERDRLGLSQTDFAALGGAGKHSQINYESDRRSPDTAYLEKLAAAGIDVLFVLTGRRESEQIAEIKEYYSDRAVLAREGIGPSDESTGDMMARFAREASQVSYQGIDFTIVPLHEAWLSAGAGRANGGANIIQHLAFRADWLRRTAADASRCCLARVAGDSMFPTLCPGDMVLIDPAAPPPAIRKRTAKDTRPAPIWAILDNGEARVKRIERPADDTFVILSDNPAFMPEWRIGPQAATVQLIGKVLWWGHTATI